MKENLGKGAQGKRRAGGGRGEGTEKPRAGRETGTTPWVGSRGQT